MEFHSKFEPGCNNNNTTVCSATNYLIINNNEKWDFINFPFLLRSELMGIKAESSTIRVEEWICDSLQSPKSMGLLRVNSCEAQTNGKYDF